MVVQGAARGAVSWSYGLRFLGIATCSGYDVSRRQENKLLCYHVVNTHDEVQTTGMSGYTWIRYINMAPTKRQQKQHIYKVG